MKLTDYQAGQLVYVHFHNEFKYRTDDGAMVARSAWTKMIYALTDGEYVTMDRSGVHLTAKGQAYVDANHLTIKPLN